MSELDQATLEWTKAKNEVRFWRRENNTDKLAMAEYKFNQACERRAKARKKAESVMAPEIDWS